jgi:hypothetical protein
MLYAICCQPSPTQRSRFCCKPAWPVARRQGPGATKLEEVGRIRHSRNRRLRTSREPTLRTSLFGCGRGVWWFKGTAEIVSRLLPRFPDGPLMLMIHAAKPLFACDWIEDSPSLRTIRELFATLPDGKLCRVRPRNSSGCTKGGPRWSASMRGSLRTLRTNRKTFKNDPIWIQ